MECLSFSGPLKFEDPKRSASASSSDVSRRGKLACGDPPNRPVPHGVGGHLAEAEMGLQTNNPPHPWSFRGGSSARLSPSRADGNVECEPLPSSLSLDERHRIHVSATTTNNSRPRRATSNEKIKNISSCLRVCKGRLFREPQNPQSDRLPSQWGHPLVSLGWQIWKSTRVQGTVDHPCCFTSAIHQCSPENDTSLHQRGGTTLCNGFVF
ncbi:hypothetical protein B0T16DRAFT_17561 [Cercophora newfieldiana]|uniref:Uncharacterized protein n=1 Tax=Cercophora newfieldiana TaxID=92897 RepID=A0AA39YQ53_9PEZI|nr:hypothetical protein B0T16DRAFT_17561 [Cercophora newfieldiana]